MRAPFFVFEGEDGASAPAGGEPPAAAAASKKSKTFGKRLSTNFSAAPGKGLTGLTEPDLMPGLETGERTVSEDLGATKEGSKTHVSPRRRPRRCGILEERIRHKRMRKHLCIVFFLKIVVVLNMNEGSSPPAPATFAG